MNEVVKFLHITPEAKIRLVAHCDIICNVCPFKRVTSCIAAEKILIMDLITSQKIDKQPGSVVTAYSFLELGRELSYEAKRQICSSCGWSKVCFLEA